MLRLTNPIRRYDWGSTTAIPELLGTPPDGDPQAELWVGAHPDSPSTAPDGRRLDDLIAADAARLLGAAVTGVFGSRLPFLTKVLAAAQPLSLQVHPDADQASAGFAEEEARAVPKDARERRYRDPFHKPEMVVALGPFKALCGWRDPAATRAVMAGLAVDHPLWAELDAMLAGPDAAQALRHAVGWLLTPDPAIADLVAAVGAAATDNPASPELATVADLTRLHPGDPGVVVALLLNHVTLNRGEALYLPAGNVHAYLRGTAVEVMATSDNVLRAGLTTKHVDAEELLRTVDWAPQPLPVVTAAREGVWHRYRPAAAEFALDWAEVHDHGSWEDGPSVGPRIVLVLDGSVAVRAGADAVDLESGEAVLVAYADGPLQVRGVGTVVVVFVPSA